MELRESLEKLELKIVNLIIQPYFKYYLSTLVNKLDIEDNISIVLEQLQSMLKESDLYLYNHHGLLVENYYSLLNFYDEQMESSSLFASQELLKIMTLNSEVEKSYHMFFKFNSLNEDLPMDIKNDDLDDNNELLAYNIKSLDIDDDEKAYSYLLKVTNRLKKIKDKNKKQELNMELENLFFLMSYQLKNIGKNKSNYSTDKLSEILKTINSIQDIFKNLGWIKNNELMLKSSISSKQVNKYGVKDIKNKEE